MIAGGVATGLVLEQSSPGTKPFAQGGLGGVMMPLHVEPNELSMLIHQVIIITTISMHISKCHKFLPRALI